LRDINILQPKRPNQSITKGGGSRFVASERIIHNSAAAAAKIVPFRECLALHPHLLLLLLLLLLL
jgi:hypothetical protein